MIVDFEQVDTNSGIATLVYREILLKCRVLKNLYYWVRNTKSFSDNAGSISVGYLRFTSGLLQVYFIKGDRELACDYGFHMEVV